MSSSPGTGTGCARWYGYGSIGVFRAGSIHRMSFRKRFSKSARASRTMLRQPTMPFFLWLRHITGQKLIAAHRQHLGAQMRDAGQEVSLYRGALPQASSISLAAQLMGRLTSASHAAIRAETQIRPQEVLNGMDPMDRE